MPELIQYIYAKQLTYTTKQRIQLQTKLSQIMFYNIINLNLPSFFSIEEREEKKYSRSVVQRFYFSFSSSGCWTFKCVIFTISLIFGNEEKMRNMTIAISEKKYVRNNQRLEVLIEQNKKQKVTVRISSFLTPSKLIHHKFVFAVIKHIQKTQGTLHG